MLLQTGKIDSGANSLVRLTDGQRDCLRLVGQYKSSKEIARELGISPHTVDQRLKRATAMLNVDSRFDAARLYMHESIAHERTLDASTIYGKLVYQDSDLSDLAELRKMTASLGTLSRSSDGANGELNEFQAQYFSDVVQHKSRVPFWSVLVEGGPANELSAQMRILIMVLIAVGTIVGFAALISVAEGLSRLS